MTKPKTGATSKKGKTTKRRMLEVEDADSLKEFVVQARAVWEKNHPASIKRRGRPSVLINVLGAIEQAEKDGKIGKNPSQGKIIRLVQEQLGQSAPSEDAIRPYVKVWYLAKIKNEDDIDSDDWIWLGKGTGLYNELFIDLSPMKYYIKT